MGQITAEAVPLFCLVTTTGLDWCHLKSGRPDSYFRWKVPAHTTSHRAKIASHVEEYAAAWSPLRSLLNSRAYRRES